VGFGTVSVRPSVGVPLRRSNLQGQWERRFLAQTVGTCPVIKSEEAPGRTFSTGKVNEGLKHCKPSCVLLVMRNKTCAWGHRFHHLVCLNCKHSVDQVHSMHSLVDVFAIQQLATLNTATRLRAESRQLSAGYAAVCGRACVDAIQPASGGQPKPQEIFGDLQGEEDCSCSLISS